MGQETSREHDKYMSLDAKIYKTTGQIDDDKRENVWYEIEADEQFKKLRSLLARDTRFSSMPGPEKRWLSELSDLGFLVSNFRKGVIERGPLIVDRELWKHLANEIVQNQTITSPEMLEKETKKLYRQHGGVIYDSQFVHHKEKPFLVGYFEADKAQRLLDLLNQLDFLIAFGDFRGARVAVSYDELHPDRLYSPKLPLKPQSSFIAEVDYAPLSKSKVYRELEKQASFVPELLDQFYVPIIVIDTRFGPQMDGLFRRVAKVVKMVG